MSRPWAGLRRCTCGRVATRPAPAPCAYCAGDLHHGPDVVEDAEWLAKTGTPLPAALQRLGYRHPESLHRTLARHGRADLYTALRTNGT